MLVRLALGVLLTFAVRAFAIDAPGDVTVLVDAGAGETKAVRRAAEAALTEGSALTVRTAPQGLRSTGLRRCLSEETCRRGLMASAGSDHLLALLVQGGGGRVRVSAVFLEAQPNRDPGHRASEGRAEDLEAQVRAAVMAVVPEHLRKGRGALWVEAEPGTTVKVDGRRWGVTPLKSPLAVGVGAHSVDLLRPDGHAMLARASVEEGGQATVAFDPTGVNARSDGAGDALLVASYALWTAGALAIAGSFVAGTLSRGSARQLAACSEAGRECVSQEVAVAEQRQAAVYARNANILLVGGGALAAAGVGLFVFDVMGKRGER